MEKAVLGISPGTRIIGIAVMQNGELIEWKVKTFPDKWSGQKRPCILETVIGLCLNYNVGTLCIKKIDPRHRTREVDRLIWDLRNQATRHGIKVRLLSLSELDYAVRKGKKQTKGSISEQIAEKHPEVRQEYTKEQEAQKRKNRGEYYTKMFEAIALAESVAGRAL